MVPVACVSEPLCVGMNFATGAKAHPNAFKPLQSTQQIRRSDINLKQTYAQDGKTLCHRRTNNPPIVRLRFPQF